MFRLTLLLVEVVRCFSFGIQSQVAAPSLLWLLSRSITLQYKHGHTERRRQKTKRWVHHRLKLHAEFLYWRELDLPCQLTRAISPQVPDFSPLSLLFNISNSSKKNQKKPRTTQSDKGVGKQSKKSPKPQNTYPEDCMPHKSNQSAVREQQQWSQHQDMLSSPQQIYVFTVYSIHRVNE